MVEEEEEVEGKGTLKSAAFSRFLFAEEPIAVRG